MKILVTGATGLIGHKLCELLAAEGHTLVVLSRRPGTARVVPTAQTFLWNPEAGPPPAEAWQGVDGVIHLAGEPIAEGRWTDERKRRIRNSRVIGTRHLIDGIAALRERPKVVVSASAVGYYGNRGDELLDETAAPGNGFLSDTCVEWEREAARAATLGLRVAQVRIGVVLDWAGGALAKMLTPFKHGLGGRLGDGRQWFPWIHLDDIVGIVRHALVTETVIGPINGVAPEAVTNAAFTRQLAARFGQGTFLPVPEFALRVLLGEMAVVVLSSQRVVPRVAQQTGYVFQRPTLERALADHLDETQK